MMEIAEEVTPVVLLPLMNLVRLEFQTAFYLLGPDGISVKFGDIFCRLPGNFFDMCFCRTYKVGC